MISASRSCNFKFIVLAILISLNLLLLYYYIFCTHGELEIIFSRSLRIGRKYEGSVRDRRKRLPIKSQDSPIDFAKEELSLLPNFDRFLRKFIGRKSSSDNSKKTLEVTQSDRNISLTSLPKMKANATSSFIIDYDNNRFLKDGEPFQIISGSIDYFRVPRAHWQNRLHKMKLAGLNAISVFVEWVTHEPEPGEYEFTGEQDIEYFLTLAAEEDLLVLLRPGPYICDERDAGGYPTWLLRKYPFFQYRSFDYSYKMEVEKWFAVLLPRMVKYLYEYGGPVIMVAVENEYSHHIPGCNMMYKLWLRDLTKYYVGNNVVLFTVDNFWYPVSTLSFKCGVIPEVFQAFSFHAEVSVDTTIARIRSLQNEGPIFCAEFWNGWPTHWGWKRNRVSISAVTNSTKHLLELGTSINFHMFHGGTNFGFHNGANMYATPHLYSYYAIQTSFDYDAPLDEAGDPTAKYYEIRNLLSSYTSTPNDSVPKPALKGDYGKVMMMPVISLFDKQVPHDGQISSFLPKTFEALGIKYGYVLYETNISIITKYFTVFDASGVHDRGHVFVDDELVTVIDRNLPKSTVLYFTCVKKTLKILVENQGRFHLGPEIMDRMLSLKGITRTPHFNFVPLFRWTQTKYALGNVSWVENIPPSTVSIAPPAFFIGYLKLPSSEVPLDTYVNLSGWGKGVIFINGVNLGRYWPEVGSQVTLYVPGCYLRAAPQQNVIVVFETDACSQTREISFQNEAILDGLTSNGDYTT